jgi:hypothetical protein
MRIRRRIHLEIMFYGIVGVVQVVIAEEYRRISSNTGTSICRHVSLAAFASISRFHVIDCVLNRN